MSAVPKAVRDANTSRPPIELDRLSDLSVAALRELWTEHMGRASPPTQKRLLVRELAWRAQERTHGGLDAETQRLLNTAIRAARAAARSGDDDEDEQPSTSTGRRKRRLNGDASTARAQARELPTATRLVRAWRGNTYEVHVLDGRRGFRCSVGGNDKTYQSLSEIAREITGTRWSGPRFFGLTTREKRDDQKVRLRATVKQRRSGGGHT